MLLPKSDATKKFSADATQRPITHFARASSISDAKPVSTPRANGITEHLLGWMIEDLRPVSITQGSGFRRMMGYIEPGYIVPSRPYLMKQLKYRYETGLAEAKRSLSKANGIALSTDIWTSSATQAYNTVSGHYIDNSWNMHVALLETIAFPGSHTGVRIAEQLKGTANRLGLATQQITGVVHDEAANAVLAGKL